MISIDEIINDNTTNSRLEELLGFCRDSNIVLYGAGLTGRTILKKLLANNIRPLFIVDDTLSKQGTFLEGVLIKPVSSLQELSKPFALIVTMMNPEMDFSSLRKHLQAKGIEHVFSFLELSYVFPKDMLPYFHFDTRESLLKDSNDIKRAFELFSEPLSQQVFLNNLSFRLKLDFDSLQPGDKDDYFPETITEIPVNAIFFDCGAFDGDTIRSFINKSEQFGRIYAFEPDPGNFNKLLDYCSGLEKELSEKIYVLNNGLGSCHQFLRFNSLSNMASSISEDGDCVIQTVNLDDLFYPMLENHQGPIFIKMDIEGAEPEALIGCKELISKRSPALAISIYHNPNDLWSIPLYLNSINPAYRYLLRQHGNDSMDLVLYAIPK